MSQESTQSISMILTAVLGLARTVRQAQEDGKIQWYEAASLAVAATGAGTAIMSAVRDTSISGLDDIIRILEQVEEGLRDG